ncbi:deoxynucleoside triphosphate triphosphohydrolase SAMHD1-like isoform X1 [Acanthaster planci]|uniref:Deoxynucleoside triphosphate triphosphohydrolase SAMHD1-like isoform X1 n=1 Tax=Acanthaster planci TaxID=133434 RepID=A0A8B7XSW3_ACAPL|nr:deoxynucleoside triphosphate triphosphohydrolase SAMHD1-like isoform X1 [Acanthaster planci]
MSSRGTKRKRNSSSKGLDRNKPPTKKRQENVQGSSNSKNFKVENFKIFNDPVHGQIKVHPLCVKIIDTPQFQRLRYIKQLGLCYLVFPGAAHNRFEHSIGVYHLAGKYCRTLQTQKPKLGIYEKDVLCVQIAGLCHDLGHGPFSHVFDNMLIPKLPSNSESKWTHEKASLEMFDHLIDSNDLKGDFKKYRLTDRDITFIKELIDPPQEKNGKRTLDGRTKEKHFLYDIVANKSNGIDVDKWDYFLRDCHNLGISSSFDCHRFMECSRVIEVDHKKQICFRDKEVENLYDMFYTRMSLHRRAYQHKTTKIIEEMLVEALIKANKYLTFKGRDDKDKRMSDAIHDMVAYTKMTDDIIQQIMRSNNKNLKPSQDILKRIERRQLYKYIGKMDPKEKIVKTIEEEVRDGKNKIAKKEGSALKKDDIIDVSVVFVNELDKYRVPKYDVNLKEEV